MKYGILFLLLTCLFELASSQGFVSKTNEINLDYSKGVVTTTSLPEIAWISPQFEYTSSVEHKVNIEAVITSGVPLKDLKIIIGDNKTGEIISTRAIEFQDSRSVRFKREINLVGDGSKFIRFVAENYDGGIVSSSRTINIGMDAIALSIDRKDYALIFATDKYDYWDDLVNPITDSRAIEKELKDKYGFQTEVVENATVNEVFEKIRQFSERKFKPQDQLLIFFAGHGAFDETFGEGYVVAKNSLAKDNAKTTYISHNRLRGIINNISCEHILLAMDVCFGGTLDPQIARSRATKTEEETPSEMVARKLSQKTRKYLTSGGKEYVSDGTPGKHSPFANKFIESLKTYGGEDRVLTMLELISNMDALRQVPRYGSFGDDQKLSDFMFIAK